MIRSFLPFLVSALIGLPAVATPEWQTDPSLRCGGMPGLTCWVDIAGDNGKPVRIPCHVQYEENNVLRVVTRNDVMLVKIWGNNTVTYTKEGEDVTYNAYWRQSDLGILEIYSEYGSLYVLLPVGDGPI